jgi:Zn-dependent peptidase ImmA (M78 family)
MIDGKANAEMLILAREVRGYNQSGLAELSGINQGRISEYEGGKPIPDYDLEVFAKTLEFPVKFFYQVAEQKSSENGEIFHRKRRTLSVATLNRIHAQLNLFRINTEALLEEVKPNPLYNIPHYDVRRHGGDIELIADMVRQYWGMSPGPVKYLMPRLENANILIHVHDFETDLMDETVQWHEPTPPIMLVNRNSPGDRLRFSLAHALGHLVMHHNVSPYEEMEAEADKFASGFLMPAKVIEYELYPVTIEKLIQVKATWKVSIQALIRRSKDIGLINETKYKSLMQTLSRAGYRKSEPFPIPPERPTLFRKLLDYLMIEKKQDIPKLAGKVAISETDFRKWYTPDLPEFQILTSRTSAMSRKRYP